MNRQKTVLVTGGAGYIGSHVTLALIEKGCRVVVVDNLSTGKAAAVPKDAFLWRGDAGDIDGVIKLMDEYSVDSVLHFAGSIIVPESVTDPLKYYHNNTCVSRNLIHACIEVKVKKFIFSSTAAVYGYPEILPVSENSPVNPINPYGISKLMTEWILRDTSAAFDFNYMALRYFNVAGADPDGRTGQSTPEATHLIKVACEAALNKREHVAIFGTDYPTKDGTGIRDYIHVADLAQIHVAALEYLDNGGESGIVNCGYENGFSVREVLDAVKKVSGVDFTVKEEARRPGDAPEIVAKADLCRSLFKWSPKYNDLFTIVKHAFDWEKTLKTD